MDLVAAQPGCEKCNRHVECGRPGIPSRVGDVSGGNPQRPALFVVGEQPGWNETKTGKCFVGKSGGYLTDVYLMPELTQHFSAVYLGNAIRCENRRNIAVTHLAACRPYLMADIRAILDEHGRLVILALGRYASMCLLNRGARDAFKIQGQPLPAAFWLNFPRQPRRKATEHPILDVLSAIDHVKAALNIATELYPPQRIPVYSTYHPAAIMSGRNPSYRRAVFDHLSLLARSMENNQVFSVPIDSEESLPILSDVEWSRPGAAHRIPELTE